MLTKIGVSNPQTVDLSQVLSWGLKIKDFNELYILTGHGDVNPDWSVGHPSDPLGQTRQVFALLQQMLEKAGYNLDNVVNMGITVTKAFNLAENMAGLTAIWAEVFKEVEVKPAGSVLRVVDALATPDMLIEIEMWAAK